MSIAHWEARNLPLEVPFGCQILELFEMFHLELTKLNLDIAGKHLDRPI